MGMSTSGSGVPGGRRRRGRRQAPMSEINVTPFVDVMLVLLIIFMVAAPLLTVGVPIDLPETRANQLNAETKPITISVRAGGQIFLQETEIEAEELIPKLQAVAKNGYEERLYVRGDRATDYGTVMKLMGALNQAGYKKIGLVTLQEQEG
ncbi:MAG: protein TolR [Pseudomonadota bacterium]